MVNIISYKKLQIDFMLMKSPLVSAVITTLNSGKTLGKLLASIKDQSYDQVEIIVIDNNSTDDTLEVAKHFTVKVFIKGPERSAQRNFGAKKASGKYLFFLDSDMVLSKDVVKECVEKLESGAAEMIIIPERSFGDGFWAKAKILEREIHRGEDYFEAARFFPKKLFIEAGGYDESLTGPEDWDLPQRLARTHKAGRIKSLILHNEGHPTLFKLAKRKYYYGLSVHQYLKKQNLPVFTPKTVYFLRPAFYRNWFKLMGNPVTSLSMFIMLFAETLGGGLGYLVGRIRYGS